jgi:acyl-CoA synthetase (AMP-forming)/AMP-acid ligase II
MGRAAVSIDRPLADLVADNALSFRGRAYLIDASTGREWSFCDVQDLAHDLQTSLVGIEPGAPVGLALGTPGAYAATYVALLSLGRTVVPLAPDAPQAETARILDAAGAAGWLADGTELELRGIDAAARRCFVGGGVVMFTSGTTGRPKGVRLRTDQLLHNASAVVDTHEFDADDVGLCPLPLWHINAQVVGVLAALCAGSTLVLDAGFHRSRFWSIARRYDVDWINAAPAIIHILASSNDAEELPRNLRMVRSASAPLPAPARERFEPRFGVPIIESYGMTEAAGMITVNSLDRPRKPGSAGRAAGLQVRVVDADNRRLPTGSLGQVQICGASVINEYLDAARAERFTPDGWLITGDLGELDRDGDLFLAGRSDDVINRGGEMVHPREVEDVVLDHGLVDAAAVVGVPDEKLGERVVALVVRNQTDAERADDLVAGELDVLARQHLSAFKRPSEYLFVADLPRGSTGKIQHAAVRSLLTRRTAERIGA